MPNSISAEVYFLVCTVTTANKSSRSYERVMNEHEHIWVTINGTKEITDG